GDGVLLMDAGTIADQLSRWQPTEAIVLAGIVAAAVVLWTGLMAWRHVRLAQAEAAWKQSLLQRGLSVDEIERLLRAPGTSTIRTHDAMDAVARSLVVCGCSPA